MAAVAQQGVTKKFITENKIIIQHPEMNRYQQVVQRVRAVAGFTFWDALHKQIWQEMGRMGLGHLVCPLTQALLLDSQIFTSEAFTRGERDNVPHVA